MYVLKTKVVNTKILHECFGCERIFPANTKMLYEAVKDKKSVDSYYMCPTCQKIIEGYLEHSDTDYVEICKGDYKYDATAYEAANT